MINRKSCLVRHSERNAHTVSALCFFLQRRGGLVLAFICSFKNTLLRIYSMPETLIGAREMEIERKRQSLYCLMVTFQASDGLVCRREARITAHHVRDDLCLSTKPQFYFSFVYYPVVSSFQETVSYQPSLLDLICEIDPYELSSSFISTALYHSIVGPFQFIYSISFDSPVGYFQFYTVQ